ncbi:hypothetical protein SAMN05414138_10222 [Rhodoplanes sp. JGI PP 4-B12]|uniref:hypothetical protein n=1 Tax=Rhodoplanes sp. JGI PP 4-B12 TaxID=1873883 RepID=UPI000B712FAE|nr:hypothetical protein [Rhodoplanes sp. JGI PP 4-B12]SNB54390.1 hypothetical protein SAMN05414138_10222 [Rhodoplanes sp. JGI PP 4-B12]
MGYRGTTISVVEMVDELIRNGRTTHEAGKELQQAIGDGIIVLFTDRDLERVVSDIGKMVSAYSARLRGERVSPGEMTWQMYLTSVIAVREQFETACQLPPSRSAPDSSDRPRLRPIESGIAAAIDNLWPDGFPAGQRASGRNSQINQYLLDHGYVPPASEEALERAIQRHLRSRPKGK